MKKKLYILRCFKLYNFSSRNVSQELSETILTMVANCSNVMNKARQPPPGVMPKVRAPSTSSLDAISPVQVFSVWNSNLTSFVMSSLFLFYYVNEDTEHSMLLSYSHVLFFVFRWTHCLEWGPWAWGARPLPTLRVCRVSPPPSVQLSVIPSPQQRLSLHSQIQTLAPLLGVLAACPRSFLGWTLVRRHLFYSNTNTHRS